jgi:hypothetical protein
VVAVPIVCQAAVDPAGRVRKVSVCPPTPSLEVTSPATSRPATVTSVPMTTVAGRALMRSPVAGLKVAVRVAGAVTLWLAAPPSLHPVNAYSSPSCSWAGAETVAVPLSSIVVVNGASSLLPFTTRSSPAGSERTVTAAVRGWSSRVTVVSAPWASVAVSRSSRCDGYSWSGASIAPEVPVNRSMTCSWQLVPLVQWSSTTVQASAVPGSSPC